MPGIYSSPIDSVLPQLIAGGRQASSGVDSDWTNLAMMYGFRPNPFGAVGSNGQDETRFLASLKNIMDQQFSAYGPNANVNAMPNYMYNQFAGMTPLYASPAANDPGFGPAPAGSAAMFQKGNYQVGALPSNQSPLIQNYLSRLQQGTGQSNNAVVNNATSDMGIAGGNTVAQNKPATNQAMGSQTAGNKEATTMMAASEALAKAKGQAAGNPITSGAQDIATGLQSQPANTQVAPAPVPVPVGSSSDYASALQGDVYSKIGAAVMAFLMPQGQGVNPWNQALTSNNAQDAIFRGR